jgi:F-type H+-transporting ATPase subunit epsilon
VAGTLTLRIISPDRVVLDEQVDSVRLPGVDGSFGILPRHAPMIAAIAVGVLHYRQGGAEKVLFVSEGFCEVGHNVVRVVAEAGEKPSEIDEARAKESEQRARERLARQRETRAAAMTGPEAIDLLRAEEALRRALKRQEVVTMATGERSHS